MGRVRKRETARRDLIEQYVWYAEHAGIEVAERFLASAESTLDRLSAEPECGAAVTVNLRELKGLRRWSIKGFERILVFYYLLSDGIDLVRVVHGSRDLRRLFGEAP